MSTKDVAAITIAEAKLVESLFSRASRHPAADGESAREVGSPIFQHLKLAHGWLYQRA